ncbi:MAG TPA: ParA family protein [Longimicrobiales bacterium]|nr:ParA family protein [Longimicrobiales bacterium]
MSKTIAFVGAKGGTLKSSSVAAVGHLYAAAGLKVTLMDADPQGTLTRRCGLRRSPDPLGDDPVLLGLGTDLPATSRLCLLPGGRALEAADEYKIATHLDRARSGNADLVLVDTPPTLGPVVRASLRAADLVVVPSPPGLEALDGYGDIRAAAEALGHGVPIRAVVVLAHTRSRILRWTIDEFGRAFPGVLYDVIVPIEMAAAEAGTMRQPVTHYAPRSRSAAAYRALARDMARDLNLGADIRKEV